MQAISLLITIKTSSAALSSLAPPCGVLLHTPQSSLLGALHLTPCWWSGMPRFTS